MNMQNASWVKWSGLTVSLAMLAGCVINPYVKAPTAPKAMAGPECRSLAGEVISAEFISSMLTKDGSDHAKASNGHEHPLAKDGLEHAMAYAICTQRAMERKAGKYAWMNQGGALMLMHMAGLAGYSGTRGGHNAQVAAMTTGGATFYGAQQYLYRKPREAIYWSGAEAVGCAITITNRRLVALGDESEMQVAYDGGIEEPYIALKEKDMAEVRLRGAAVIPASCKDPGDDGLRTEWQSLTESVDAVRATESLDDLGNRRLLAKLRLNQLLRQSRSARTNLIGVTSAIRLAVNRQLAAQQPDPAELARLFAGLKPSALAESTPPVQGAPVVAPSAAVSVRTATTVDCVASREKWKEYQRVANEFRSYHRRMQEGLKTFTTGFDGIQAEMGGDQKSDHPIEQCLQLRGNALRPFGVVMAQSGPLKVVAGGTARVAIVGGLPPFDAQPLVDDSKVGAEPKLNERGEYEFVITVATDADVAKNVKFFATDDAGGSDMFTVDVVAPPK